MKSKRGKGNSQGKSGKTAIGALDDPIHPAQFWATAEGRRWDPALPDKKLWSAVLEDAFLCCVYGKVCAESSKTRKKEEIESARAWFLSEDTDIGTFLWVCKALDLDPNRILDRVRGLYPKKKMAA